MGIDRMMPALYRAAVEGKHEDYYEALRQTAVGDNGVVGCNSQVTPSGNTVLHVAALHGQKQFVENILETEEDGVASSMLLARNKKDEIVLHCAAEKGYADIVSLIITATKKYKDVELGVGVREMIGMRDKVKDTALHKAVRMGHLEVVKLLVKEDPEFEYPANEAGETPIYIAAELQFDECLVEMLNTCKKPTYGGPLGRNALHAAILSGFEQTTSWFKNWKKSRNYLHGFAHRGDIKVYNSKCTRPVLEREISLCEKNDDFGWTPLHYAIKVGNAEAARMILERKACAAYIHAGNDKEWTTVFHIAARGGNVEIMKEISNRCPDCWEMMNSKGQNVLHEAIVSSRMNVLTHIEISNQFDNLVLQQDEDGNIPLHLLDISNPNSIQHILSKHPMQNYLAFNKNHQTLFDRMDLELKRPNTPREFRIITHFRSGRKIARRVGLTENPKRKNSDEEEEQIKATIETSKTSIVVATLILTMTFAAGFTVPGGYNSNPGKTQGMPLLLRNTAFWAFIIANIYAFTCSICSITIHSAMVGEASSSRRLMTILHLYVFQRSMLYNACFGVVIAFLCGMYATLAPLRPLAIAVLLLGFGIPLHTYKFYSRTHRPKYVVGKQHRLQMDVTGLHGEEKEEKSY